MRDDGQLKEKLRSIFFEITFNQDSLTSTNDTFSMLIKQIDLLFMSSYIAIFIYNDFKEIYQLIDNEDKILSIDLQTKINDFVKEINTRPTPLASDKAFIRLESKFNRNAYIIPLTPEHKPNGFMLLILKAGVSTTTLHTLKRELEQYLNMYNCYNKRNKKDKRNQFLYNLSTSLNSINDLPTMLTVLIQSLQRQYPACLSQLYLSQDYDLDESFPVKPLQIDGSEFNEMSTKAFISGEMQTKLSKETNKSYLYAPLKGNQGIYGVIEIMCPGKSRFPSDEVKFIRNIANTAGTAMENAILYQHSKHLVSDLKLLNDATQQLNSNVKTSELIKIVKKKIIEVCHASEIGFILFDKKENKATDTFNFINGSTSYFYTEEGYILTNFIVNKMKGKEEPIFRGNMKESIQELTYHSLMSFPMKQSGTVHGLIILLHKQKAYFTFEKFKLMRSLTQHSTLALTNTILKDELEKAVITDYLTKLYTRSFLDEMVTMHMKLDERGTLLLFDIDDFKDINDMHGHHIGDKVIIQVATIIQNNITDDAIPTRWGGEELAVYLPHVTLSEGRQLADKIRIQIERLTHPQVTASCGVSEWTSNHKEEVIDVFLRADKALYAAKRLGKNSIMTDYSIEA